MFIIDLIRTILVFTAMAVAICLTVIAFAPLLIILFIIGLVVFL